MDTLCARCSVYYKAECDEELSINLGDRYFSLRLCHECINFISGIIVKEIQEGAK